jgi:hypothetical protein
MNNTTVHLVKDYITKTLDEPNGISAEAWLAMGALMREDREFALEMHDVVDRIATSKGRYFLLEEDEVSADGDNEL